MDSKYQSIKWFIIDLLSQFKKTKLELDTMVKDLISKSVQVIDDNYDFANCVNIHTYGLCVNNGMDGYSGSIGIFYSQDDFKNTSKKITKNLDEKNGKKRLNGSKDFELVVNRNGRTFLR
jgi:hypothetical protein